MKLAGLMVVFLAVTHSGSAQISKGYQILLNRGLQLQGMVQPADYFHWNTYSNVNYTSVNWFSPYNPSLMGPPPGVPWSRWVNGQSDMPPEVMQGVDETPYLSQLVSLEMGDELNLNVGLTRTNEINWFNAVRTNFPNTILYINNYGGQVSDANLGDFISKGQPDMICFDEYPFQSDYNSGVPMTWPFTSWLSELRRYRQWSINTSIPFGTYMQTFNSVESYDQIIYRNPSPSELRFNTSAALAFNAKVLTGFTYNTGAAALFNILPNGYSGDLYTNSLYGEQQDANLRAQNLGRALMCLKPVYDLHNTADSPAPPGPASSNPNFPDGTTTSILILKGNPGTTNNTPEPIGFQDDPALPKSASWWESDKNDSYLAGWVVTNEGTNNSGLAGQVFISWFTPLDESFDGPTCTNEIYMMVVNGLTTTNGTAAGCLQQIKLNFLSTLTNVVMLDAESGLLVTNTLASVSGRRQLVLNLNGGDAALFKFADGAPFVGHIPPGTPNLSGSMQSGLPQLNLSQLTPGARYQVQSTPVLTNPAWSTLAGLVLTNSTYTFVDTSYTNNQCAFYRVVGVP